MKKILVLLLAIMTSLCVACGKQEENENNNKEENNNQNQPVNTEDQLTSEDYEKITSLIETERKNDKISVVKITYKNESEKEFEVKTVTVKVTRDGKTLATATKEVNEIVAGGENKVYSVDVNLSIDEILKDGTQINWEMSR